MRRIEKSWIAQAAKDTKVTKKALEFPYGKSDIGLWDAAAAFRRRGRGRAGSSEAHEWARGSCHHACAGGQQGRHRETVAHKPGSVFRSLSGNLNGGVERGSYLTRHAMVLS